MFSAMKIGAIRCDRPLTNERTGYALSSFAAERNGLAKRGTKTGSRADLARLVFRQRFSAALTAGVEQLGRG